MDGDTSKQSGPDTTEITGNHRTSHPAAAMVSHSSNSGRKFQISSDYYRKVDRTTDIAGRLPNAIYTLPPHIVQAIVGLADVTDATREELVAEGKKFYLAHKQYEESKEVFVDGEGDYITTITLDCGRLYAERNNRECQCGIGSGDDVVTDPRLIRIPPVLQVWCGYNRWFAKTTRGLYAWGNNEDGGLGSGFDDPIDEPLLVPIDSEVLDVYQTYDQSFFRTASGWLGCGWNFYVQLALGHTNNVNTPTRIPGSERATRWGGDYLTTFAFTDGGLLACGDNRHGQCGVGSTNVMITTLTPVALSDYVKGRVDRVVCRVDSTIFIAGRRCFACGSNMDGERGLESNQCAISTPTELPIPVDDISEVGVTPVIDKVAKVLNGREPNGWAMVLPEPINNNQKIFRPTKLTCIAI